jgi:chromosome segregation ATPase
MNPENGNQEGGYEDSAQKRDRLEAEYKEAVAEVKHFISVADKDNLKITELFDNVEKIIDELQTRAGILSEKIKALNIEITTAKDESAKEEIAFEIDNVREQLLDTWDEMNTLRKELKEDSKPLKGDLEGTKAVLRMKWQKVEDIQQQIKELDKQDEL